MEKKEIMQKLGEYHKQQGIVFLSQKDAEDYFKGLVDLIESLIK
jgi:nucleoid DNA-binding protein